MCVCACVHVCACACVCVCVCACVCVPIVAHLLWRQPCVAIARISLLLHYPPHTTIVHISVGTGGGGADGP